MPCTNLSTFIVPRNKTALLQSLERMNYAEAELFKPDSPCQLPGLLKLAPTDVLFCLIYLFGVGGLVATALYLYWRRPPLNARGNTRNGQSADHQLPIFQS